MKAERGLLADERGYAMAEFALVFPVQLLITLGIMQLCLLYVGHEVVQYAAYTAARAALVNEDPMDAAVLACAAVAGPSGAVAGGKQVEVPGWGVLPRSAGAVAKTRVTDESSGRVVQVLVEHDYELGIPVINRVFALGGRFLFLGDPNSTGAVGSKEIGGAPHITLRQRCALYRPWE